MMSTDFLNRLLTERTELIKKKDRLGKFIGTQPYLELELIDRYLLPIQYNVMETYIGVLNARITLLGINSQ